MFSAKLALAFVATLLLSAATAAPVTDKSQDAVNMEPRSAFRLPTYINRNDDRPTCTANEDCVNWGQQRCGDPFGGGCCLAGHCCGSCEEGC
ncbi:hypothetical protein OQA88_5800 [Cercophora sp. LCS_1]